MSTYVTEYEICALLFLIIITVRFFSLKLIPKTENRVFGCILIISVLDLILDIIGSLILLPESTVSPFVCYAVNSIFFLCQIALPLLLVVFVIYISGRKLCKKWIWSVIPASFFVLSLIVNPINGMIFTVSWESGSCVYSHGKLFFLLYVFTFFYLSLAIAVVIRFRKSLRKNEIITISLFVTIISATVVIQFFMQNVLLTGVSIAISILLMFLTMQNPESSMDTVTRVFNYGTMRDYFRHKSGRERYFRLILLDIGGMRKVNNSMGINHGNTVMGQVGSFLNRFNSKHSMCFQTFGTKFVIICDKYIDLSTVLDEIKQRFEKPWGNENRKASLILTCRYTSELTEISSSDDIEKLFDLAFSEFGAIEYGTCRKLETNFLYSAGRYNDVTDSIRRAISSDSGFSLRFQPIKDANKSSFSSAEVLLRLDDPIIGAVSPDEFIPIAERSGLIRDVDRIVLKKTAAFLRNNTQLAEKGLKCVEINLSATEFSYETSSLSNTIVEEFTKIPFKICFEITETASINHPDILSDFMNEMVAKGYTFALDDFGTGYASVSKITGLPFSVAKIDRSFVISPLENDKTVIKHIVMMFHSLGIGTVAEGVETVCQAESMETIGIDKLQGFLYSKPLTENEYVSFMESKQ